MARRIQIWLVEWIHNRYWSTRLPFRLHWPKRFAHWFSSRCSKITFMVIQCLWQKVMAFLGARNTSQGERRNWLYHRSGNSFDCYVYNRAKYRNQFIYSLSDGLYRRALWKKFTELSKAKRFLYRPDGFIKWRILKRLFLSITIG